MKRSAVSLSFAAAIILSAACSYTKGGSSIAVPDVVGDPVSGSEGRLSARDVATLVGEWNGSEVATVGESGTITAVFAADDFLSLTWVSATTSVTAQGSASGSLSALSITSIATQCSYTAHGSLSADQNTISGTYQGSGPGACPTKKGSFTLTRKVKVVDVCPNLDGVQLTVPEGYELKDGICVKKTPPQPTCDELNRPFFDAPTLTTVGNDVKGKVHKIHNTAVWTLKIYRDGKLDDTASKTLKCQQAEDIDVSSKIKQSHTDGEKPAVSHDFYITLEQDGVLVYTSSVLHVSE